LLSIRSLGTVLAAGVLTTVVAACGSSTTGDSGSATSSSSAPVTVAGSVVSTAGSSIEAQMVVPNVIASEWSALGSGNGVEWVAVAGDGTATTARVAVADCQRMVWTGQRWMVAPGSEPADPPSVWPDTDAAFDVGYRDLRHA